MITRLKLTPNNITLQTRISHLMITRNDNTLTQRHFSLNKLTLFHNLSPHALSLFMYYISPLIFFSIYSEEYYQL